MIATLNFIRGNGREHEIFCGGRRNIVSLLIGFCLCVKCKGFIIECALRPVCISISRPAKENLQV